MKTNNDNINYDYKMHKHWYS